jgi:hypothetical protein
LAQAEGTAVTFQDLAQGNVFHEIDIRETPCRLKKLALDKDCLVTGGNACEAGT